jgi:predicted dehydrogenase
MKKVKVAFYGCGGFAQKTRLPNILAQENAEVVALSDVNVEMLGKTAALCGARTYTNAHEMLEKEAIDALYSIVPAYARTDVEVVAAQQGIHLFSEKPQVLDMELGRKIERAIANAGVISTVGVRERYRPLFQEAKKWLQDKKVVHARFQSMGRLPNVGGSNKSWYGDVNKSGGTALDWGVHATDYLRFMTGLEVTQAQAFYYQPEPYTVPLSASIHYAFNSGATAALTFLATAGERAPEKEPWFTIYYQGGCLAIYGYERLVVDGETIYEAESFDPWLEQDRIFIAAVQNGDASELLSDYRDALYSLGPVLAAWDSAQNGGEGVDVGAFMGM